MDSGKCGDGLDPLHIFGVLVAELPFDPQAQRRAVGDRKQPAVHSPGQNGLRVEGIDEVDAFIIRVRPEAVGLGLTAYINVRLEKHTETHKRNPMDVFRASVQGGNSHGGPR